MLRSGPAGRVENPTSRMRIGLISDTHGQLRSAVFEHFEGVDLILHAGDVGSLDILVELEAIAPVHAVIGNTDGWELRSRLPEVATVSVAGRRILVTHGHLLAPLTPEKLRATYPDADIIVYGHTHRPLVDQATGALVVNPGAAGPARFRLKPSLAILTLDDIGEQVRPIEL